MLIQQALLCALALLLGSPTKVTASPPYPSLTFAYNLSITFGSDAPTETPFGRYEVTTLANATWSGPGIQATAIVPGILYGPANANDTSADLTITWRGVTDDGVAFAVQDSGHHGNTTQYLTVREKWIIGGRYSFLSDAYIFCQAPSTSLSSTCWFA